MPIELKIPSAGESIVEVEVGRWLKNEGDHVELDEPIVEIETDKATQELNAPVAGTLTKVLKKQGETAAVGDIVGMFEEGAPGTSGSAAGKPKAEATPSPPDEEGRSAWESRIAAGAQRPASTDKGKGESQAEPRVMPAAERLLQENKLQAADIKATGPGGRVLKEDVLRHLDQPREQPAEETPAAPSVPAAVPAATSGGEEEIVPMTPMRRRIAQRLVEAQQTAAMLTTFNEIDMSAVMTLRNRYKESFEKQHGVKLGFMSFFVKAAIDALKQFPAVNAEVRDTNIVYKNHYDIGIAVGTGKGLVVPVLRHAERMSFAEVEKAIGDFIDRLKNNRVGVDELRGGTFTITNGGVFGSLLSTPILNPPQSGILGMHTIQKRPVVVDDQIVIRPMMYVALTYDHRIVDGREAITFLNRIKQAIEDPTRMLIET